MWRWLIVFLFFFGTVAAQEIREPSEFRLFRDKQQKEIEARILSITEDERSIELEKKDGVSYEIAVTVLSLDDQQFIRNWLEPEDSGEVKLKGTLRVFGVLPKDEEINASAAEGITEFQSIHAAKYGWLALLPDGKLVNSAGRFSKVPPITHISSNTVWVALTSDEGAFINGSGKSIHSGIATAIQCVNGNGHSAALLEDGTVKAFGRKYDTEEFFDAPGNLPKIVSIAGTQGAIAAVGEDGSVHCWGPGIKEPTAFTPGDGAVEVHGNIFQFIALTRRGEVYQWSDAAVGKAKIPSALNEEETYIKVRGNGNTLAAQREDKTWIAWGMNGAGIVDHINSLGPTEDIAFFSEPGRKEHGYVIWVEE